MKLRLNFLNNNYILIHVFEENIAWFNFFKNIKNNNQYFPTVSKKTICPYIPKPDISYVTRLKDLGDFYQEVPDEIIPTQSKKSLAEKTIEFINACNTKDELRAWELMAKNNPDLMEIYNAKLKSL